jgi:hypothetical protein
VTSSDPSLTQLHWYIHNIIILDTIQQQIIMPQPRLKYLLASSRCIQQATPQYRTPRDYRASVECSREAGQEDRAIVDVS